MNPERLKSLTTLVTHDNCADGTGSALLIKDVVPNIKVIKMSPGSDEIRNLPITENTIFCDITPAESTASTWKTARAIVLDHHIGNKDIIDLFEEDGVYECGDGISGATLAFKHVWMPLASDAKKANERLREISEFAALVGIKDTNVTSSKRWKESCAQQAALTFYPFKQLMDGFPSMHQEMMTGEQLVLNNIIDANKAIAEAYSFQYKDKKVLTFSNVRLSTEVSNIIGNQYDVVVGCNIKGAGAGSHTVRYTFSMRSHTGFNVMLLAKKYAGGGHEAAAGFQYTTNVSGANPFIQFETLFKMYMDTIN